MASRAASAEQREVLQRVGGPDLSDVEIGCIQDVLRDTGAVEAIERDIERLTTGALEAIATADITEEARVALVDLAHFVAWRDT